MMTVQLEIGSKDMDEVKKVIRALLLSTKHGLTVTELCSEYTSITSKTMPYKEFGYYSAVDLVKDIPDVARPIHGVGGVMYLKGIPDEHTAHISALVNKQKSCVQNTKLFTPQQQLPQATKRIVSNFIQSRISTLIKKHHSGVKISLFENDYLVEYGKRLNPELQGFNSIKSLLESCSDVVRVKREEGHTLVYPAKKGEIGENSVSRCFKRGNDLTYHKSTSDISSSCNISKALKQNIFSVLMRCSDGLFAANFLPMFKNVHNVDLDIQSLGFNSVIELMSKLSDIVDISRISSSSDWLLTPKSLLIDKNGCIMRKHFQYCVCPINESEEDIEVYVTYIVSPSLFWIQLYKNQKDVNSLMNDINDFYNSANITKYCIPMEFIVPGLPCIALYSDDLFYRAIISKILSPEEVTVFFVDYGDSLDVKVSSLCLLKSDFIEIPCQSIATKIHYVNDALLKWSEDAVQKFYELTQDQRMLATVVERDSILSIKLCDFENRNIGDIMQSNMHISTEMDVVTESPEVTNLDEKGLIEGCGKSFGTEENGISLVKCLHINESYRMHIIRYESTQLVVSAEVSGLFWNGDILKQMLCRKGIQLSSRILCCQDNKDLFAALIRYSVNGVLESKNAKPCITTYELSELPYLFSLFKCKYVDAKCLIENEIQHFKPNSNIYWHKNETECADPQENSEEVHLKKLEALKSKRKRLFHNIMFNEESTTTLAEINNLNQQIKAM